METWHILTHPVPKAPSQTLRCLHCTFHRNISADDVLVPHSQETQVEFVYLWFGSHQGVGCEPTYPWSVIIQSFRAAWASCSWNLGAGMNKTIKTKPRRRRSSKLPPAEQVPSSSFQWTCWISECFKAEAGELLNVDMFYSWQWDLKPLKHTGSMTALWTWNERSQRRTPNVLGSNYQITC